MVESYDAAMAGRIETEKDLLTRYWLGYKIWFVERLHLRAMLANVVPHSNP